MQSLHNFEGFNHFFELGTLCRKGLQHHTSVSHRALLNSEPACTMPLQSLMPHRECYCIYIGHRLTLAGDFTKRANTLPLSRVMDAR